MPAMRGKLYNAGVLMQYCNFFPFESIYSLFDFDPTVRSVVHEIKYGGSKRLGFHMGRHYHSIIPETFLQNMHAVIPVPLHTIRHLKRGYNQAEYIAREL